jgi:glycosyltransferase involved in cell wall biosynthesis
MDDALDGAYGRCESLRILFFTDHFYPEMSAPAGHVYERAKIWVGEGHDVTVITNAPNTPRGRVYEGYSNDWRFVEELDGVRVVRVKTYIAPNEGTFRRVLDYLSYMVSSFVNAMLEARPDVVISTSPHLFVPVAGMAAAGVFRVPHVFEVRDLWPASIAAATRLGRGRIYRMLERLELFLYRRSRRVIAFTPAYVEDLVRRGVPEDKIDVVLVGANLQLFTRPDRDHALAGRLGLEDRFVVGYLGTIGLAHGLENVLYTAELLRDFPVMFLFVGEGAEKDALVRRATAEELTNVVFVPRQAKEDVPRYWSICDAALVHLKDDPVFETVIPSKIFEAMAVGLPIIYVGPRGEGSRIVEAENAGIVVPSSDPEAFRNAVVHLATDVDHARRLSASSAASARKYSREAQAEATLETLARAVRAASRG